MATSHNNQPTQDPHRGIQKDAPTESTPSLGEPVTRDAARFTERVAQLLALIRPAIQEDGGDIELVAADPSGLVQIRLLGACVGCPSAGQTLHHGIERTLRAELGPDLRVEAVASARP